MALNIKNLDVERLAADVSRLAGESKTEAIRKALEERRARLILQSRRAAPSSFWKYVETEVWPALTPEARRPLTPAEEDEILGYGPHGV